MQNSTRVLFDKYAEQIARLNGISDASKTFSATPSVQQTLETRIQESSDFLNKINMRGVRDLKGQKIGLGITSTIAKRTSTANLPRQPISPTDTYPQDYECQFTEFDTAITYQVLDAWSKFPDFQARIRDAIIRRQALDRMVIGFHGTSAAANTNRTTNPLLQDVNLGWLQQYRANAPDRVMSEVVDQSGEVNVGPSGDYENLDALVFDAVNELIDPWYRDDTSLVAIMGRALLHDKYFPLVNQQKPSSEVLATDMIISQKRVGGLQAVRVPYFPDGKILITSMQNLSIYWQEGARRRHLREQPEYNRIVNYESTNDAYVIEDYGFGCLIENIVVDDFTPGP